MAAINRRIMFTRLPVLLAMLVLALAAVPSAHARGPVILGGDDLTEHGSVSGGASQEGWLYMEKAVGNIKSQVSRSNDNSIAAFGSADSNATSGDAGAGIKNAAAKNGMTVQFFDGASAMASGFQNIANGSYRPAIIWIAGDGADNDLDGCSGSGTEGQVLIDNAATLSNFLSEGGGVFSHGSCYEWLSAILPGLTAPTSGASGDLFKTAEGNAAFPGVGEGDFNAGPWHNHFQGNFGGLAVLVRSRTVKDSSGQDAAVVIGGSAVTFVPGVPVQTCQRRPISLVYAAPRGRSVVLSGLVSQSYAGRRVRILTNYRGARGSAYRRATTVRANALGQYTARVRRPSRSQFIRARFRAQVSRFRSGALKLPQSLVSRSVRAVRGTTPTEVVVRGTVKRSVLGRRNPVTIKVLVCGRYRTVGRARPDRRGNYAVRFIAPRRAPVALYRAESMVLRKPGSRVYVRQYARAIQVILGPETG